MGTHVLKGRTPHEDVRAIMDSLRRLVRELRVFSRRAEATAGISAAQLFVLQQLAEGKPRSVNELAALTLTHQSSVSVVVRRLEERGLAARRASDADGRRVELSITPAGRTALKRAPRSAQNRLIEGALKMKVSDRRALSRLLGALLEKSGLEETRPILFFEGEKRESQAQDQKQRKARVR